MSVYSSSENYVWFTNFNLGKGGFGLVYLGAHKETGEEVAVKTFIYQRPSEIHMREFEVMKVLSHENIVKLLAIEKEVRVKKDVLIMELCRGGNLQKILDEPENTYGFEEKELLCVLKDLTAGLKYLRDNNIVHRDVKPANIMKYIADDGSSIYKLADFGSARYLEDNQEYQSLYGTEEYLHPALYKTAVLNQNEDKAFSATTDLWSVGATIYQVATGLLPFRPFGGRRNRETMLFIHNHKPSGVISGVQHAPNTPVEWSKELPETCLLNNGLRDLVTTLLAGILESKPEKMWTFGQFFGTVTDIISRKIFHVFYMNEGKEISLYMHPNTKLQDLEDEIYIHTQVRPLSQLLLFDNSPFKPQIDPSSDVSEFPATAIDNPLILVHKENTGTNDLLQLGAINIFPSFSSPLTSTENDAAVGETCCIKAYAAKRLVVKLVRCQELLLRIPRSLISLSTASISKLCSDSEVLKLKVDAVSNRRDLLRKTASVIFHFTCAWPNIMNSENHDSDVKVICDDIKSKLSERRKSIDKLKKELAQLQSRVDFVKQQLLIPKNNRNHNEQISDLNKCVELANTYVGKIRLSWQVLMKNKYKKVLTLHDQPLHMVERAKIQSMSRNLILLQSEVLKVCTRAVNELKTLYSRVQGVETQCKSFETDFKCISNDLSRCSTSLQQDESELFELATRIIAHEIPSSLKNSKHQKQRPVTNGNVERDDEQSVTILEKFQTFHKGQEDIRQAVEENKSLIEEFKKCFQNGHEDNISLEGSSSIPQSMELQNGIYIENSSATGRNG